MEIRPILASLRKHRIPSLLIMLEIALACAVLCNAVFMIGKRVSDIHLSNAIDETGLSIITVEGTDDKQAANDIPRNLAALRSIAGVTATAVINTMPLSRNGWNSNFGLTPNVPLAYKGNINATEYLISPNGEKTLDLRLLQGRYFNADEYADSKLKGSFMPSTHVTIITDSFAKRIWPGQSALGKTLYSANFSYTVVGIVADVLRPSKYRDGETALYYSTFFPLSPDDSTLDYYLVRSEPQDRGRVLRAAIDALSQLSPNAVIKGETYATMRNRYFEDVASMAWMLVLVCVVMLAVTALGIVGLTSFWVGQRRKQIGIRRAIGARRSHITQYFQTENFLLSTGGVVLGMALAFGINLYLIQRYEMDRMPWYYLPCGAVALWLLGQFAVLGPALHAAAVPPVVATRSI